MGIYIRNIDIPEIKRGVAAIINIDDILFLKNDILLVPDHGDLIDRDELMKHKGSVYDIDGHELYAVGTGTILRVPVVIPAERSEE